MEGDSERYPDDLNHPIRSSLVVESPLQSQLELHSNSTKVLVGSTTLNNPEPTGGLIGELVESFWERLNYVYTAHETSIQICIKLIAWALFFTYMGFVIYTYVKTEATLDWCNGYGMAFLLFGFIIWCALYYNFIQSLAEDFWFRLQTEAQSLGPECLKWWKPSTALVILLASVAYIVYDCRNEWTRLRSFLGIIFFVCCGTLFSKHPTYIKWDAVLKGLTFHLIIGLFTIKTELGRGIFNCIGNTVVAFLEYAYTGATFVFGTEIVEKQQVFAFQSLSVLYFLATIVQMMFHLGWIQKVCFKVGAFIQFILDTTVIESVNAVATVFLGLSEAPLLVSSYIQFLTPSEMHTLMTSGFATVAGTLLAAYTALGIEPKYVVTASAMAAPGSLTISKIFFPETKHSATKIENIQLVKGYETSVLDAACKGAFSAIEVIASIIASVIACVSIVAFADGVTTWLGQLVGIENLTIEYIFGLIFVPLAWLMGVQAQDCELVGSLIGIKSFANEFIAYKQLGEYKLQNKLSPRSEAIATFSLCGFANPGSVASMVAMLASMSPNQKSVVTSVAFRAYIAGSITSFTSACVAGLLIPEQGFSDF